MKPAIGAGTGDPVPAIAEPAGIRIGKTIECWHIGLDIQERGPVKDIHIVNNQLAAVDRHKTDNRKPDGVRPLRRPGCKDPVRDGVKVGHNLSAYPSTRWNA